MQNRPVVIGVVVVVAIAIGAAWYFSRPQAALAPTANPTATSTTAVSTTTATAQPAPTPQPQYAPVTLPISSQDSIASWSFTGAYSGDATLVQKAAAEITRLKGLLANTQDVTVQETYISIGKEYELIGDGKDAYDNFLKALNTALRYEQEDALAWANLGDLLAKVGAYHTAQVAYTNATKALPGEPSLYVSLISFLLEYMPHNNVDIQAAFAAADKNVPGDASVAQLHAQYEQSHPQ